MYEVLNKIKENYSGLTSTQRLVADYILINYNKIAFVTITTMSNEIGVSDKTIINFCSILGFNSFSKFKKVFSDYIQSELAIYDNFEGRIENLSEENALLKIIDADKSNIDVTLNRSINRVNIDKFIDMIDISSHIYICGMRSASILMNYLAQSLRIQKYKVTQLIFHDHLVEKLCEIDENDLFINFSFSRYTSLSVKALEFIKQRGIPTVSFTDSITSPTYKLSDICFICESKSYSYQASYVGVLSLINVIVARTTIKHKEKTRKSIDELETGFKYFNTFTDNNV